MIEFYPSKLDGAPCETYPDGPSGTIESWLLGNVPTYRPELSTRISARLNGVEVPHSEWSTTTVNQRDLLQLYAEPKGIESIVAIITLGAAATFVSKLFNPTMATPGSSSQTSGNSLDAADVKGNQVKLNDPIREVAGRRWIYPDYILPPHRYFNPSNGREQFVELLLSVGVGKFEIPSSRVLIGDTPAISLGDDVNFEIFDPMEDISGRSESAWWHSATEVGPTSTGGSGLELSTTWAATPVSEARAYIFDGDTVTVSTGAGQFPTNWAPGLVVRIVSPRTYQVTDDSIVGDFSELDPFVGMQIEIAGDNAGLYSVASVTSGAIGTASTLTGNAAPSRYDFGVTNASFTVTRNGQTWSVNLTADLVGIDALVSYINSQFTTAPLIASRSGTVIRISEKSPYSGLPLGRVVSDGATAVFGSSPVGVTGTATTDGRLTLNFSTGGAVVGLATGSRDMTIGYAGLRYRLVSASTTVITVERLTDTGATDASWPGFSFRESTETSIVLDGSTLQGGWVGPFVACPEGEVSSELEYDIFFPAGLVGVGQKNGEIQWREVTVDFQYRRADSADPWVNIRTTHRASIRDQFGKTQKVLLPAPFRAECRMRRVGARSSEPNTSDAVQWYGLRAKLTGPTAYPVTTLALRAVTTNTLSAKAETLVSLQGTRILETIDGAEATTRNPADFLRYIAHSVGYSDDDLDMTELERLHALWASRGDYFDNIFDTSTTVFDAMTDTLRVGYAVPSIDGGLIVPVRDEPRTGGEFDGAYSPQNLTQALSRGFSAVTPDDPDGVDVEYYDETTRQWLTVECRLPGDTGVRVEKLRVPGVTGKTRAWRIGMRRRRELAYRRKTYQLNTEMDGLNDGYWSYVALSDDIPGYSQSAIVEGYNATTQRLTVSESLQWVDGADHVVGVRRPTGSLNGPIAVTRVDDYTMQLAEPLDFVPVLDLSIEPPYIQFGTLTTWAYPALISSLTPTGTTGVTIEAVNYDARVYEDDDNSPP